MLVGMISNVAVLAFDGVAPFELGVLQAVSVGQHHVRHDNVRLPGLENLFAAGADHGRPHLVTFMLEKDLQPLDHRGLVIDGEHPVSLLHGHKRPRKSPCIYTRPNYRQANKYTH